MFRKKIFLTVFVALLMIAGCANPTATLPAPTEVPTEIPTIEPTSAPTEVSVVDVVFPLTVKDEAGNEFTFEKAPQRIVSLSPALTETLFAVGAGELIVGNTDFCDYPEAAKSIQKVGGYSVDSISVETIVSLKPDLVMAESLIQSATIDALKQANLPVFVSSANSYEDVFNNITTAGKITDHGQEAEELISLMNDRIEKVQEKVKDIPEADRPKVFWEVWDEPLMTIGPNTFLDRLIREAGGINIFSDAPVDYPSISAEEVIKRNPDFIMGPGTMSKKLDTENLATQPGWGNVNAIVKEQIVLLDDNISSRPGPRIVDAIELIAKALYPELFK
jgi:iron complex transport system substrate-binding protein